MSSGNGLIRWIFGLLKNKCFLVGYPGIAMKIFFDLSLVPPVKIPNIMFLLSRLLCVPHNQMEIWRHLPTFLTLDVRLQCFAMREATPRGITEKNCTGFWYSSSQKGLKTWNKQSIWVFFRWEIEIYFILWSQSVIFSLVAAQLMKIQPMIFSRWNKFRSFTAKNPNILYVPSLSHVSLLDLYSEPSSPP